MSGGEYNYLYCEVDEFAEAIIQKEPRWCSEANEYRDMLPADIKIRKRIAIHLHKVAKLMRAIEWCDSGDTGEDTLLPEMEKFLKEVKG